MPPPIGDPEEEGGGLEEETEFIDLIGGGGGGRGGTGFFNTGGSLGGVGGNSASTSTSTAGEGGAVAQQSRILDQIMEGTYGKLKGQKDDATNVRLAVILKTIHSLLMKAIVMASANQVSTTNPIPEKMQRFQGEPMPNLNDD